MKNKEIAIIGGGVMGQVLSRGITESKVFHPQEILVFDHNSNKLKKLEDELGVKTTHSLKKLANYKILLLAVKPDNVSEVLKPLLHIPFPDDFVLISIVAGVPLSQISTFFRKETSLIRVMTNTPCLIKEGMSVISPNSFVSKTQLERARQIFNAVGKVEELPEKYLDAVTGLSGSGPAFFFLIIDAMIEAGVLQGLPRRVARELVIQTMKGSASLIEHTQQHPGLLRDMVTSPGGTTISGIQVMEEYKIRAALLKTIETATQRSKTLGHSK